MAEVLSDKINHQIPVERKSASEQLDRVKEKIMNVWETRVREFIKSASGKSTSILRSQLPELLENLASSILPNSTNEDTEETGKIGKNHGEQRANLLDYNFPQVLQEYRILRQVIFEVLEEEKLQVADVRDIILNVLDQGVEKAIEQFSYLRSEEINRSNRDLQHFAAIAAHDLKSPLATITGFSELLEECLSGKVGIEETQLLQAIQRSSARMTLLIDRLLEYSSVGNKAKKFKIVSVNKVLMNVIENLKPIIENSQAKLQISALPDVFGDISLLSQLFQNFISNALKFREPRRILEIKIEAIERGKDWLFSIHDNGIGFDPKNQETIFSLFKRLDISNDYSGSGIGLATARKVVELHGGKVWAESQPGYGSIFRFTLPKLEEDIRCH